MAQSAAVLGRADNRRIRDFHEPHKRENAKGKFGVHGFAALSRFIRQE
jgi:hypothetical protein